jgi:hypothetical protein
VGGSVGGVTAVHVSRMCFSRHCSFSLVINANKFVSSASSVCSDFHGVEWQVPSGMATELLCLAIDDKSEWRTKREMARSDEINSIPVQLIKVNRRKFHQNFTRKRKEAPHNDHVALSDCLFRRLLPTPFDFRVK